jgi:hypothetical protein
MACMPWGVSGRWLVLNEQECADSCLNYFLLCVTLRHTQPEVAQRFVADLRAAVEAVQREPRVHGDMAPVYGLAARVPLRGQVGDLLKHYLDMLYRV